MPNPTPLWSPAHPKSYACPGQSRSFSHETGKVLKLDLGPNQRNVFSGNAVKDFKPSEPFHFLGLPEAH